MMDAARAEPRQVTHVFHPDAEHGTEHLDNGVHVHVAPGEPAYQVSSGEIINL